MAAQLLLRAGRRDDARWVLDFACEKRPDLFGQSAFFVPDSSNDIRDWEKLEKSPRKTWSDLVARAVEDDDSRAGLVSLKRKAYYAMQKLHGHSVGSRKPKT